MNYNQAYDRMIDSNASLSRKTSEGDLGNFSFLGSWANHYKSWKNNFEFKTLIIKYEELEKDAYKEFQKVLNFIEELKENNQKVDKKRLLNAIDSTNFSNLKKKEELKGFQESPLYEKNNKTNFFNLGFKNKWKEILPKDIAEKLKKEFLNELKELGYE